MIFRIYGTIQKSRYERALMTAHQVGTIVMFFIVIFAIMTKCMWTFIHHYPDKQSLVTCWYVLITINHCNNFHRHIFNYHHQLYDQMYRYPNITKFSNLFPSSMLVCVDLPLTIVMIFTVISTIIITNCSCLINKSKKLKRLCCQNFPNSI